MGKLTKDAYYKREEIRRRISDKLTECIDRYNVLKRGDPDYDDEVFKSINSDWRIFCHLLKKIQKLETPNPFAFTLAIYPDSVKITVEEREKEPKIITEL